MPKTNKTITQKAVIVGAVIALILILDQLLKVYVKTNYEPGESTALLGDWFVLEFTENPGMAFGTKFGTKMWHKLALSLFRIVAIAGLIYYWLKQAKKQMSFTFLLALGFVIAGATGNLIDSAVYDFIFPFDPCYPYNHMPESGIVAHCNFWGDIEVRPHGFLMGNVVDMFKFSAFWPNWMPWLGGAPVFPAIWNLADGAITTGVVLLFINQQTFFGKKKKASAKKVGETQE